MVAKIISAEVQRFWLFAVENSQFHFAKRTGRCHDTKHADTKHNAIIYIDIKYINTQNNDTKHSDTKHNNT